MIMFGSFLPSLSWLAPPKFTRASEPNNDHYRSRFSPRVSANSFSGHRHRRIPGKTADASRGGGEDLPCSGVRGPEGTCGNGGQRACSLVRTATGRATDWVVDRGRG